MAKGHGEVQTLHDAAKHGHRHRVFVTLTSFGTSNSLQLELESLSEPPPFHMTGSQLPPELIHQIVQELGDDFETLKECSLASRVGFPGSVYLSFALFLSTIRCHLESRHGEITRFSRLIPTLCHTFARSD